MEVVTDRSHIRGNSLTISRFKKLRQQVIVEIFLPTTIREELIMCGKSCLICPHGPYYYAYWKSGNGKLKKKYIGSRYDKPWKNHVKKRNKDVYH